MMYSNDGTGYQSDDSPYGLGPPPIQGPRPPTNAEMFCDLSEWMTTFTADTRIFAGPGGLYEFPQRAEPSPLAQRHIDFWNRRRARAREAWVNKRNEPQI